MRSQDPVSYTHLDVYKRQIVDGIVMMEDRRLTQVEERTLLQRAEAAFTTMMKRLNRPELLENPHLYDLHQ